MTFRRVVESLLRAIMAIAGRVAPPWQALLVFTAASTSWMPGTSPSTMAQVHRFCDCHNGLAQAAKATAQGDRSNGNLIATVYLLAGKPDLLLPA